MSSLHTPLNTASLSESSVRVPHASTSSTQNYGSFAGASHVDARHAMINQVTGNQNNIYNINTKSTSKEAEENALLDKLPRATDAGYSSRNHRTCLEGTRTEVLKEIEKWEIDDFESFVYWLKGVAGCGKSVVAQTFAELSAKRKHLGASFFCSRDFPDRRNLRLIIPTLAYGLALRFPEFKTALLKILDSHPTNIAEDSLDIQFESLIVKPLKDTGLSTTIVVDALDECENKEPVSEFLSVLAKYLSDIPNVKFFVTGRPEDHVRAGFAIKSLRTSVLTLHDVDLSSVDSDIRSFVRFELTAIATRNPQSITGTWPSEKDIDAVAMKSSGHFIVASVILKFVGDRHGMPQERLDLIISALDSTILEGSSGIDGTYDGVLKSSFNDAEANNSRLFEELRIVLACIVLAFRPLSRASIAGILGMSQGRIWQILQTLHSVLIVPDSESEPIRICHKSFADFLTDSSRCLDRRFHINDSTHHHFKVGVLCLKLMDTKLGSNLSRYKDVTYVDAPRENYIESTLAYACEYWAKHLQMSRGVGDDGGIVVELVDQFFRNHFLSWLEVLSIEANLRAVVNCLRDVISWMGVLEDVEGPLIVKGKRTWRERLSRSRPKTVTIRILVSSLLDLIDDCEKFVLYFFELMEASAMHILHSALPWSPTSSLVRRVYEGQSMTEARIVKGIDVTWGPSVREDSEMPVRGVRFSPNGQLLASRLETLMKIWDTNSGKCLAQFKPDSSRHVPVRIEFSPNSEFVALGMWPLYWSSSWEWIVWNVRTRRRVNKIECNTGVVALSSDATRMASVSSIGIDLWSLTTGEHISHLTLDNGREILEILFDTDGLGILATTYDGRTKSWRIPPVPSASPHILVPMQEEWSDPHMSAPSQWYVSAGHEWIFDRNGMRVIWVPPDRRDVNSIDIHGKKIAVVTKGRRMYIVDFSNRLSS